MYKSLFSKSLSANPGRLHFAAHSHHLWPDASHAEQQQYWIDSATHADDKWDHIFSTTIPAAQAHIARHLNLSNPGTLAFAPNTHELVNRILSCLKPRPKILTTDSEFYSFTRQIARLREDDLVDVTIIPTDPLNTFIQRFSDAASAQKYDLVFFSHVFFNSGFVIPDLTAMVATVKHTDTIVVIDGYHGFMALPTDLAAIESRAFYLAGGYKYAMAGEGCCFIHCPPGYGTRPRNTGWYADMGALDNMDVSKTAYGADGARFWGATFDPSGLYRMNAVMAMLAREHIDVGVIHNHVAALQDYFLSALPATHSHPVIAAGHANRGHFITFDTPDAGAICAALRTRNIITDHRGPRLRFGFGLYHDRGDVDRLAAALTGTPLR